MRLQTFSVNQMENLLATQQNRSLTSGWQKWHRAMVAGQWNASLAPIILYPDGTLADGQHRIRAALEMNEPFTCYVTTIDRDEIVHVDAGRPRSTVDHAKILGLGLSNRHIAIGRACLALERQTYNLYHIEHGVLLEAVVKYDIVTWAGKSKFRSQTPVAGVCAFVAARGGNPEGFYQSVATGANLSQGDPALLLRNWLMNNDAVGGQQMRTEYLWRTTKCWNAYVLGQTMTRMASPKSGWSFIHPIIGKEAKDGQDASE
jgi:hypothetical protein